MLQNEIKEEVARLTTLLQEKLDELKTLQTEAVGYLDFEKAAMVRDVINVIRPIAQKFVSFNRHLNDPPLKVIHAYSGVQYSSTFAGKTESDYHDKLRKAMREEQERQLKELEKYVREFSEDDEHREHILEQRTKWGKRWKEKRRLNQYTGLFPLKNKNYPISRVTARSCP